MTDELTSTEYDLYTGRRRTMVQSRRRAIQTNRRRPIRRIAVTTEGPRLR